MISLNFIKLRSYSTDMISRVFLLASLLGKAVFVSELRSMVHMRELGYLAKNEENYRMLLAIVEAMNCIWPKMKTDYPSQMFGYTLPVNGDDIMEILQIGPGPKIKEIQEDLIHDAFANPDLSREECINLIKTRFGIK